MTSDKVLKSIAKNRKPDNSVDYRDVENELKMSDTSLTPFLKELSTKGYITQFLGQIEITDLGLSASKKASFPFRLFHNSPKFLLNVIIDVAVGLLVAFLVYHFGWQ